VSVIYTTACPVADIHHTVLENQRTTTISGFYVVARLFDKVL
jgi:hypothetical protein